MPQEVHLYNVMSLMQHATLGERAPLSFALGEEVFVALRSHKWTGRARVLGLPEEKLGRIRVQFLEEGGGGHNRQAGLEHEVRFGQVFPVVPIGGSSGPAVIVTAETFDFRRLARTQVRRGDAVIELGCSFGDATKVLAEQAGPSRVVGVDLSSSSLEKARALCPATRFEQLDVLACSEEETAARLLFLASCVRPAQEGEADNLHDVIVFVDIGGNRLLRDLMRLLQRLFDTPALRPAQVIVKSRELFVALEKDRAAAGARTGSGTGPPQGGVGPPQGKRAPTSGTASEVQYPEGRCVVGRESALFGVAKFSTTLFEAVAPASGLPMAPTSAEAGLSPDSPHTVQA